MPALDIVDETFVRAPVDALRATLCNEAAWAALGMNAHCYEDRGDAGKRWTLFGALTGTAEVWLEQNFGGVLVHIYIRADPRGNVSPARLRARYAHRVKRWVLDIKTGYDMARPAGETEPCQGKISVQHETPKDR
jgi:hypothetical protein